MMKKTVSLILVLVTVASFAGCGARKDNSAAKAENTQNVAANAEKRAIDVDLTALSSTMVYSEVYNMMMSPEDYIGKTVKMSGQFSVYQATDENGSPIEGAPVYYACVIADATACCQQGLEFVLTDPDTYPEEAGSEITVEGIFQTYYEEQNLYCHLVDAQII